MLELPDRTGLPRPALATLLDELGIGAVHTDTLFAAMHRDGRPLEALYELGYRKQERMRRGTRSSGLQVGEALPTQDDTEKLIFTARDGARVEGVLIGHERGRVTFCVSSQVGCAMGCGFCATATLGLRRGLEPGEIAAQIGIAAERVRAGGRRLANVVFMGMGEPLHHYEATRDAIHIVTDHYGLMLAERHITVSTVGLIPQIRRLADDFGGRIQLAVSLSAGTGATRRSLVPVSRRWGLDELRAAVADYPLPGSRYVLIEYVLLAGVNDTAEELAGLVDFVSGLRCLVNLIPFNPFPGSRFTSPGPSRIAAAELFLRKAGVPVTVRRARGRRAHAACGQLALTEALT